MADGVDPAVERVLALLPAGVEGDVRLVEGRWGTMRFANSRIHQPHLEAARDLSLRVRVDGRIATATTADLRASGLASVVRSAVALARVAPTEPRFPGFPAPERRGRRAVPYSAATATLRPEAQARLAEEVLAGAREVAAEARISGAVNVGGERLSVGNTSGLRVSTRRSMLEASALVERPNVDPPVSGWSELADWDAARVDLRRIGREAAERMAKQPPASARPGSYRVVLLGSAVVELLSSLGYLGFGGLSELEGWSCLRAYRGRRLFPRSIDLIDDGPSTASLPQGIDYEGSPKRRTSLIEEGKVGAAVTDLVTAGRLGVRPSGHALPPESPYGEWGPIPTQMLLRAGDAKLADLIRATGRGLLITRFHYVRVVHPGKSVITGMTRDGTYRIERGEIAGPVRNLRFTQSVIDALRGTELVGSERRRFSDGRGFSSVTAPALLLRRFRFTSATVF